MESASKPESGASCVDREREFKHANKSGNNWAAVSSGQGPSCGEPPVKRPTAIYSVYHCPWNPIITKILWYTLIILIVISVAEDILGKRIIPTHDHVLCWLYTTIKNLLN